MSTETEVKIYVADLQSIQHHLEKLGAVCTKPRIFERNLRYDTPDQALYRQKSVLRLRQDSRARVTFKGEALQLSSQTRTLLELETEVADFDVMDSIFRKLGLEVQLVYEKFRTTYEFENTEIVLDEMPFGNFIEVEGTPEAIDHVLSQLNLQQARRILSSYVAVFEQLKQGLRLTFRDLSFENFAGVVVPAHLFDTIR